MHSLIRADPLPFASVIQSLPYDTVIKVDRLLSIKRRQPTCSPVPTAIEGREPALQFDEE